MTILSTQRLSLRRMTDADLDDMAALLGNETVMTYYPGMCHLTNPASVTGRTETAKIV